MAATDIFTVQNALIALAVFIALTAGVAIFIAISAPKKLQKTAILYNDWFDSLGLPPLSSNAKLNAKAVAKFFKIVWPKKYPEELDVHYESSFTQTTALEFTKAANEILQPKKSPYIFIYDVEDASTGFLRLYSVAKESKELRLFYLGQGISTLLKEAKASKEFPRIELPDHVDPVDLTSLDSFIVTNSGFPTKDEAAAELLLERLSEKFGGVWLASALTEDALLFRRQTDEDLREVEAQTEVNPFQEKLELKKRLEAERIAEESKAQEAREEAWREAEKKRLAEALQAREAAIAAGEVSRYVTNPLQFLSAEIELAADAADLLTLDDEPDILKVDGLGSPLIFCVYNEGMLEEYPEKVELFSNLIVKSMEKNLGGEWRADYADSSLTFKRVL